MMSAFDPTLLLDDPENRKIDVRIRAHNSQPSCSRLPAEYGQGLKELRVWQASPNAVDQEDTEDEEVKINCIGGFNGIRESDMSTEESSDDEDAGSDDEFRRSATPNRHDNARNKVGLVHFVSSHVPQPVPGIEIQRPRAVMGLSFLSEPRNEDGEEELSDDESSSSSSSGARGLGLSLETATIHASSEESESNEESSDEEIATAGSSDESDMESEGESDIDDEGSTEVEASIGDGDLSDDDSVALSVAQECFENFDTASDDTVLENALGGKAADWDQEPDLDRTSTASDKQLRNSPAAQSVLQAVDDGCITARFTKSKRVLSSNALAGPVSSSDLTMESPKRMRFIPRPPANNDVIPTLPPFSLGPSASDSSPVRSGARIRVNEPVVSPSNEDADEEDRRLSEELEDSIEEEHRENTPVPLLTPPASPLRIESEEGPTTLCEWPSNLTVDSAMTAAIGLRPPSPNSLQTWEQEEEERIIECWQGKSDQSVSDSPNTALTPLLRGISVRLD